MQFADIRTEWRVNDIERSLQSKAESHQVSLLNSDVASLERTVRGLSSLCDGLRYELQTCQDQVRELQRVIDEDIPNL